MLDTEAYAAIDTTDWDDTDRSINLHAILVTAVGGGPIRTLITGGRRTHSGRHDSAKTRRTHPWKQPAERDRMIVCEVDSEIASYLAQPHRLDFAVGRQRLQFFPDLLIEYRSGKKAVERIRSKAEIALGLGESRAETLARRAYEILGWDYRVLDPDDVPSGRLLANCRRIQMDRWTVVDAGQARRALEAIAASGGEAPFGAVMDALGGDATARAQMHSLIIRARVAIDLEGIFDDDTPVRRGPAGTRED